MTSALMRPGADGTVVLSVSDYVLLSSEAGTARALQAENARLERIVATLTRELTRRAA